MGRYRLDLHCRDLLDERSCASRGHGVADTERRQQYRPTVLPHLLAERGLLRVLHVCRHQLLARGVCLVLRT